MWSHYGEKHNGICLGFDLLHSWTLPISYEAKRLLDAAEDERSTDYKDLGRRLLTTKYEEWEYEKEVRMIIKLNDAIREKGHYFLPFCHALRLRQVIIGARSSLFPKDIKSKISPQDRKVRTIKSRLAFRSFKVVKNRSIRALLSGCA